MEEGAGIEAVVIEVSLLSSMKEKLFSTYRTESSPFTIRRVPANIREYDHAAYNPRIVSIGPFHRGRENLQAMEKYKWRCLQKVLAFGKLGNNLEKFLEETKAIETQARNCYSENMQMSINEFVEMMVLDGCFLIFLILERVRSDEMDALIPDYERKLIFIDMLLLENQLPFFVLECLWKLVGQPSDTLRNEALTYFKYFLSYELELKSPEEGIIHLLHLLHLSLKPDSSTKKSQTTSATSLSATEHQEAGVRFQSLKPDSSTKKSQTTSASSLSATEHQEAGVRSQSLNPDSSSKKSQTTSASSLWNMIPSATELQAAGVRFQLKRARSFFEVTFERGLMEMPRLWIDDFTNILFRNFIAFEQCFPNSGNHFTTYCSFIDFLVDTPTDVSILREADIIRNGLGSNEEVALLFNKLGKEIVWSVDGSYLADLFEEVFQHTQKRWAKCRAKLVRDYFGCPCAIISIFIASVDIILILTFIQTYFSVFAYFKPPN